MTAGEQCHAIARINRIGNGFNGHRGNYRCKAAAVMLDIYRIIDVGTWRLVGFDELPTCAKHAGTAKANRREIKREAKGAQS
jgi:hypothetical protein